jgi:hypothetical protein
MSFWAFIIAITYSDRRPKWFTRKTFAIPAAFMTLLAVAVPAGLLDLTSTNWTLGGVPCTKVLRSPVIREAESSQATAGRSECW